MPRRARIVSGGQVYHVFNRINGLGVLFDGAASYREFVHLLGEAAENTTMRVLAYCAMPNHWHMPLWPRESGDLRKFVQKLTIRHSHRWHVRRGTVGRGALYQGRYRSCLVQSDRHLLTVCRYVERNPLRAGLVETSIAWPWSSAPARARELGFATESISSAGPRVDLEALPVPLPENWLQWIDEPQNAAELERIRHHTLSGAPFGDAQWIEKVGQRASERPLELRPNAAPGKPGTGTSKRYK